MKTIAWHTEKRKINDLIHCERNPRLLTKKQTEDLKKSLTKFDLVEIPAIDIDNKIIAGHQRIKIMQSLGKGDKEIDVRVPTRKLTQEEFDEYLLRSNKNTGEWDFDGLAEFDIDLLHDVGFTDEELIFTNWEPQIITEDEVPEIGSVEPKAKLGDIWQLGKHKVMCGDSTNADNVQKLLDSNEVLLMVTDPPYGVRYDPSWREGYDLCVGKRSKGLVENDDIIDWSATFALFNSQILYVWHAAKFAHEVAESLIKCDYEIISQLIWAKQHFVLSRGDYHWQHEPCWYAVKKGMQHNWQGARDQSTLWQIKNNNSFGNSKKEETWGHGTQKPVECMMRPILNNSSKEDMICDPFLGSGTTLIACEQSNRICYGMEISPQYVDVIISRWEKLTGKQAELLANET